MMPFSGFEMPVEYSGLIAEHQAVRRAAGLFDVSHMGQFEVKGAGALAFLQRVTANDVAKLVDGQAQYSALPLPTGCPVDDVIVYRRAPDRFLIVVNAANLAKDWEWLKSQSPVGCTLEDLSEAYALIALQGPKASITSNASSRDRHLTGVSPVTERGVTSVTPRNVTNVTRPGQSSSGRSRGSGRGVQAPQNRASSTTRARVSSWLRNSSSM